MPPPYNYGMSRCNKCNPCGCGGGCEPARYSCDFSIQADPYNPYVWLFDNCGKISRINIPRIKETDTFLRVDFSTKSLIYDAEYHQDVIDGCELGEIINLDCLADVEAPDAESCDLLVFDPGCSPCGDGCKPKPAVWRNYHIPDAEDCEMEVDEDGYYKVLTKDECGCIVECRMPVVPDDTISLIYIRDSVPDDPDYPWYYGCYNDEINLYLEQNCSQWFGKYDLEITIMYGVQAIKSDACPNVNFRSIVVPVVAGTSANVAMMSSTLQNWSFSYGSVLDPTVVPHIPWGSCSLRGSFSFIVPKGKEAHLHHEFRLRSIDSFPDYKRNPTYDAKKVPEEEVTVINRLKWNASRLNALQAIIRPVRAAANLNPTKDAERDQLDYGEDVYPNPVG